MKKPAAAALIEGCRAGGGAAENKGPATIVLFLPYSC